MIDAEFEIHPVGQGLFYTGMIGDFVIVYDVGTLSGKDYIQNEINLFSYKLATMKHKKIIDVLFLSHYDSDHISGIKYLVDSGFRIKKIIAPLITPLVELSWLTNISLNTYSLPLPTGYRSLLSILSEYTDNLVQVESIQEQFDGGISILSTDNVNDTIEDISSNAFRSNTLPSVTTMRLKRVWQFTFFAQCIQEKWVRNWLIKILEYLDYKHDPSINLNADSYKSLNNNELAVKIYKYITKLCTLNDPRNNINDVISKIHSIAKTLKIKPSQLNMISLVLYHRPLDGTKHFSTFYLSNGRYEQLADFTCNTAQLLTGDSVFKKYDTEKISSTWPVFRKLLPQFEDVALMFVPHHGSKYGWHNDLLSYTKHFVVSYGLGNTFFHPSAKVIKAIAFNQAHFQGRLFEVNQQPNSRLIIYIK